ncbi:hypothetical protein [Candidatus Hodarchaeum mangrovi]
MTNNEEFLERPLIQQRIVLISIDDLFGHEQTVRSQIDWLKENLQTLGYFFRPILVAKGYNVVLDGHHRVEALKELGGKKIPCIEIDYLENEEITLDTWHPLYTGDLEGVTFPEVLTKLNITWIAIDTFDLSILADPRYGFTLITSNKRFRLEGPQQDIFDKFLNTFNPKSFEYSKTVDYSISMVEKGKAKFALLRRNVTKQDVIDNAIARKPFAPKTTRHILSFRYQDIKVPLDALY